MKVVVYTADIGGHDETWGMVEQVDLPKSAQVHRHRLTIEDAIPHLPRFWDMTDRLLARWFKCHPHVLFPDATLTIWVDACIEVTSPHFVRDIWGQVGARGPAMFPHPDRQTVHQEVEAAATLPKYAEVLDTHRRMVTVYEYLLGAIRFHPLMAMTVIARRQDSVFTRLVDHYTWTETVHWDSGEDSGTPLDQLILPFVASSLGVQCSPLVAPKPGMVFATRAHSSIPSRMPSTWAGTLWENDWFVRHPHRRET